MPEAYAFLLRFACGIESKLSAETEIFGQIKHAWSDFSGRGSPLSRQLSPLIQLLFQDAKAIRAQHLAASAACLLRLAGAPAARRPGDAGSDAADRRRPARHRQSDPGSPSSELWLWNRNPAARP